jgi:HPt (histidine-containing phosphotransfer) domain-containing protein
LKTLDPHLLLRNVDGDPELLAQVVTLFFESCGEILASIRNAVTESDGEALSKSAHQLRGALANVGALVATEVAAELELLGREGSLAGSEATLRSLELELEKVGPALAELVVTARGVPPSGDAASTR